MNYLLPTARYEHTPPQYLADGLFLGMSLPHHIQQRYKDFFSFFLFIDLMTKFTNNWSFQHFLNRPISSYTVFKKSSLKSFFSSPLGKRFSFASISKQMIISTIKVLIPQSIPTTIRPSIITLGINAVKRGILFAVFFYVDFISRVHFIIESLKIHPFLTNSNSSPTIILKSVMIRIKASLLHSTPYLIKPSSALSVFHNYSLANSGMIVNQFYTPMWITKSQLTDIWNKANKKVTLPKNGRNTK